MSSPTHTEHHVPFSDSDRKHLLNERSKRRQWLQLAVAGMATAVVLVCMLSQPNAQAGIFIFLMIAGLALITIAYVQIEKLDAIRLEFEHQTTIVAEGVLERRITQDDEGNEVISFHLGPYQVGGKELNRKFSDGDPCQARLAVYCGAVYSIEKK